MLNFLKQAAIHSLQQLHEVLAQLDNEMYANSLPILFGSTIGMHVRHIVEFYTCFIQGEPLASINYDARERNMQLEKEVSYSRDIIELCMPQLHKIEANKSILLYTNDMQTAIPTSTFRELTYLIEHSIHHMAILKMALSQHCKQVIIPENFGVAYSTIKHKELCAQ